MLEGLNRPYILVFRLSQSSTTSQMNDDKTSAKKKSPIPLWPEWTDQEIANEKWVCHRYFWNCLYHELSIFFNVSNLKILANREILSVVDVNGI